MGVRISVGIAADSNKEVEWITALLESSDYILEKVELKDIPQVSLSKEPDLIILGDQNEMNALEMCKALKDSVMMQDVPIVIVGAKLSTNFKINALESGAIDCFEKPFVEEEILARIKRYIKLHAQFKQANNRNSILREQFSNTFEHAAAGITHVEIESGRFLKVNKTMAKYLGYSVEELQAKTIHDVTHPNYTESDERHLKELKAGKISSYSKDKRYVRKDGSLMWGRVTVSLTNYNNVSLKNHMVAVVVDISARKTVEEINYKLYGVIERSRNIIMITNKWGQIEYINPAFQKVTGYRDTELAGKLPRVLQERFNEQEKHKKVWNTITSGKSWKGEFKDHKKNGEEFWQHISIDPITNDGGQTTNYILIAEDITDEMNMLNELKCAKQRAEESDRMKTAFLASISHEIRTPLNSIVGFSDLIATTSDDPEHKEYAEIIKTQNELLLQLINDMLDYSKLEAGGLELKHTEFDMSHILQEMKTIFLPKCSANVNLHLTMPVEGMLMLCSDKNKIQQILINLLSNAIKFTKAGHIKFGCELVGRKYLRMFVHDTGIGISKERQEEVFTRFTKVDSFSQGTGLGLTIVKYVVDMFGGSVELNSDLGKGTKIGVTIPVEQPHDHLRTNKLRGKRKVV